MVNQPIGNMGWEYSGVVGFDLGHLVQGQMRTAKLKSAYNALIIKRPTRDACLCMGDLQAPLAPHFVFLITSFQIWQV